MNTKLVGQKGEDIAVDYLMHRKYKILERNYRTHIGEIDIIAKKKNVISFVEVKYRENLSFGLPRESVTISKQNKIRRVAEQYLIENRLDCPIEFDVLEITPDGVEFIEKAF